MYAEERRLHILDLLKRDKRVDVSRLAERFGASPETIRRDLRELESDGDLKRTHGGAISVEGDARRAEIPLSGRKAINSPEKIRIARRAAALVEDGDMIAIDNSTTAACMAQFIPRDLALTILTNSLPLAVEILSLPECGWNCICLGGMASRATFSTSGSLAANACQTFRPNKLFMSCAGIDAEGRITEGNLPDAELKRELIAGSQRRYLLADAAKLKRTGAMIAGNALDFDILITNASADRKILSSLHEKGLTILLDDDPLSDYKMSHEP